MSRKFIVWRILWSFNGYRGFDDEVYEKIFLDGKSEKMGYEYAKKFGFGHEWWNFYEGFSDKYYFGYAPPLPKRIPVEFEDGGLIIFISRSFDGKWYFVGVYGKCSISRQGFQLNMTLWDTIDEKYRKIIRRETLGELKTNVLHLKAYKEYSTVLTKPIEIDLQNDLDVKAWRQMYFRYINAKTAGRLLNKSILEIKEFDSQDEIWSNKEVCLERLERVYKSYMQRNITIHDYFKSRGYCFAEHCVSAFYTALKTKGFVILAGLTGTGKTRMPQLFFDLTLGDERGYQKLFLPVRPDWRDSKPLVGYFNPINETYVSTSLLNLIFRARKNYSQNKREPFFVLLDEMNLARVEYYFADFLSILESGRDENGFTKESILLHELNKSKMEGIPSEIKLPPNLYFIGTVNLDETTYSFSPKVLDRSFVIEFWDVDLDDYPPKVEIQINDELIRNLRERIIEDLSRNGKFLYYSKEDIARAIKSLGKYFEDIKILSKLLKDYDLHFGYRVMDEIALFYLNAKESWSKGIIRFESDDQIIDLAILMKVLPKIHGNRSRMKIPLLRILYWAVDPRRWSQLKDEIEEKGELRSDFLNKICLSPREFLSKISEKWKIRYLRTASKVARMLYQLYTTGFTSFL